MNLQLPKVSVIIATYGNKEYLKDAIDSAISQTYDNTDVWVIDDASPEDIMPAYPIKTIGHSIDPKENLYRKEEIETYENLYATPKKLHYIRLKKNSGPSVARNIAIANAMKNGSHLVQILDSDDILYPNKITTLLKPIMLDPERIGIAYADYLIKGKDGVHRYESKPVYDYMRFFGGECHIHSGALISALALKDRYPYFYPEDQRVCEDYFLARCILRSTQFVAYHVPEILTIVRSHDKDSTSSVEKEVWERDYQKTMMNS